MDCCRKFSSTMLIHINSNFHSRGVVRAAVNTDKDKLVVRIIFANSKRWQIIVMIKFDEYAVDRFYTCLGL